MEQTHPVRGKGRYYHLSGVCRLFVSRQSYSSSRPETRDAQASYLTLPKLFTSPKGTRPENSLLRIYSRYSPDVTIEPSQPQYTCKVSLEPSSYTDEKFFLYRAYLTQVHGENVPTPDSFRGHLVDTPFHKVHCLEIDPKHFVAHIFTGRAHRIPVYTTSTSAEGLWNSPPVV